MNSAIIAAAAAAMTKSWKEKYKHIPLVHALNAKVHFCLILSALKNTEKRAIRQRKISSKYLN